MKDNCDSLTCDVPSKRNHGSTIIAYKYAKKKSLRIVNFYD